MFSTELSVLLRDLDELMFIIFPHVQNDLNFMSLFYSIQRHEKLVPRFYLLSENSDNIILIADNGSVLTSAEGGQESQKTWFFFSLVTFVDETLDNLRGNHRFKNSVIFIAKLGDEVISANCIVIICSEHVVQEQAHPLTSVHLIESVVCHNR